MFDRLKFESFAPIRIHITILFLFIYPSVNIVHLWIVLNMQTNLATASHNHNKIYYTHITRHYTGFYTTCILTYPPTKINGLSFQALRCHYLVVASGGEQGKASWQDLRKHPGVLLHWHASVAKNSAAEFAVTTEIHRRTNLRNLLLCNLDGDNIMMPNFPFSLVQQTCPRTYILYVWWMNLTCVLCPTIDYYHQCYYLLLLFSIIISIHFHKH